MSAAPALPEPPRARLALQRRTVRTLVAAQILGGLGVGATLSVGALLIARVTGNDALSGLAATMSTLGAAAAGIPLARLAVRRGRRVALASGNLIAVLGAAVVVVAAAIGLAPLLFLGIALLGVATAVQLQSRFAATDLAGPGSRARDLSIVVWATTIGAVVGPNLIGPGERIGAWLGFPELTGVFAITVAAQLAAAATVWLFLRPDPLAISLAERAAEDRAAAAARSLAGTPAAEPDREAARRGRQLQWLAIGMISLGHAVMVGLMAMTPLHLTHTGGSVSLVGLTISLHIAGMYALSPVFGLLAGRWGPLRVIVLGAAILLAAAGCTWFGGDSHAVIQLGLVLLGLGWSALTVAAAALLTAATPAGERTQRQGQSDTVMNLAGAAAGAAAGALFAVAGFPLVSAAAVGAIAVVLALALLAGRNPAAARVAA